MWVPQHTLTRMQASPNKDLFVWRHNVFWIRRYRLGLEGVHGQFQFVMQISVATIVLEPTWYDCWFHNLLPLPLVLFRCFWFILFNSVFISSMHPLHQTKLTQRTAYTKAHMDQLIISALITICRCRSRRNAFSPPHFLRFKTEMASGASERRHTAITSTAAPMLLEGTCLRWEC